MSSQLSSGHSKLKFVICMKKHKYLYVGSELVVSKGGEVKLKAEVEVGMAACQFVYCLLHLEQLVQLG